MRSKSSGFGGTHLDSEMLSVLFSDRSGGAEVSALQQLVEKWCRDRGGCAAALYSSPGARQLASSGNAEFPDNAREVTVPSVFQRLELPGGAVLLHTGIQAEAHPLPPDSALLGASVAVVELKRRLQEQNLRAMSQGVELVALYEVGLAIASILDLERLAEEVLARALMLTECSIGALYTLDEDGYRLASSRGSAVEIIGAASIDLETLKKSGGRPDVVMLPDAADVLAVSVEAEGQPRGLLAVGRATSDGDRRLTAKDRSTLSLFANQAAIALEQARLHRTALEKEGLEREMELAAEIQQEILPDEMPEIEGFEILGWNRPARHVGGDYFGFKTLSDRRCALVLGDVSGKGAPAALLVSTLDSALRVLLDQLGVSVDLGERLNQHVLDSSAANKFITLVVAELDTTSGMLRYLNAGHNEGVLLRSDGHVDLLEAAGPPIGMLPGAGFEVQRVGLTPGDLVCFYSDGITECEAPDEEEFELDRLTELLEKHRERPLGEIMAAIDVAVSDYRAGLPQGDDQTVILLRRERSPEE